MNVLAELQLLQFTLLPHEILSFIDDAADEWRQLLESVDGNPIDSVGPAPSSPPHIQIKPDRSPVWFQVRFPDPAGSKVPLLAVKGEGISRAEQEHWLGVARENEDEILASEFPVYQLLCIHLLPLLHARLGDSDTPTSSSPLPPADSAPPSPRFHALFTSHHLISSKKRRSLQQWSHELSICGFAKVGYPGVIYAQGEQSNVEEFVENVKAMQWLVLRLRFLEPIPDMDTDTYTSSALGWTEFEKVGQVVERMRGLGLEAFVVEMGVGSKGDF